MSKSRRRRIPDPGTPTVRLSDHFYAPKLCFEVAPVGRPHEAVTYELDGWQWRAVLQHVAHCAAQAEERHRQLADGWARLKIDPR